MRKRDILETIGDTPLIGIQGLSPSPSARLWAKLEGDNPTGSVKDRIALRMVEEAEARGELTPDRVLLEPTSGNTGIALAMVARRKGYRLVVVMPKNASRERVRVLRLFGAEIVESPAEEGTNGAVELARTLAEDPRYLMLFQYGNPANVAAHEEGTGPEILRDLPEVTHFVAGLGTGGTLMGVGRCLKAHDPSIEIVAAEPQLGEDVYGLRSLDAGFIPPILDESLLDRRFLVEAADAVRVTRLLAEEEGVFAGISSGAIVHVARRVAAEVPEGDIVCLLPDGGWKYLSTDAWTGDAADAGRRVEETVWW